MKNQVQPGIALSDIPGLNEAIADAKRKQSTRRENALLNLTYNLHGFTVRTMTVRDYVLLDRANSPFISRREPDEYALAMFLWQLSPQFGSWVKRDKFPFYAQFLAFLHGRKVKKKFCRNIPESSEPVVISIFEYIDEMFMDSPPTLASGQESCLSYLTYWFDSLQSEYHFSNEQIWDMGLPELFQRLSAIRQRRFPQVPQFNKNTDAVRLWVLRGLRSKEFTLEDLSKGRVKMPFSRN